MYRGWVAAITVSIILTLTLLAVEKHFSNSSSQAWKFAKTAAESVIKQIPGAEWSGIQLQSDSNVVLVNEQVPSPIARRHSTRHRSKNDSNDGTSRLRRPPEPAANAVLCEPLTSEDFVTLPLTHATSSVGLLMESMDAALEGPMKMVSMASAPLIGPVHDADPAEPAIEQRRTGSSQSTKIPVPTQLMLELKQLAGSLQTAQRGSAPAHPIPSNPRMVTTIPLGAQHVSSVEAETLEQWLERVESQVDAVVSHQGLESSLSRQSLQDLEHLARSAMSVAEPAMAQSQADFDMTQSVIRTGYSLLRRVEVWKAVQACLGEGNFHLASTRIHSARSSEFEATMAELESHLKNSYDSGGWREYLLVDDFIQWARDGKDRRRGSLLAQRYISRVSWSRLEPAQIEFLRHPAVQKMTDEVSMWNRDPIDYRHLLANLELVEQSPESRAAEIVAESIQMMRHAPHVAQQHLASVLNTHYRNANLRLTISKDFIERFLPEPEIESRPVRQRILGAYTAGDSAIQTQLSVTLLPDPSAWNIGLELVGEVVSNTQSSKGPAVLHNTGLAHVESQRFLRLGTDGYQVSSSPTYVSAHSFLNKMSTDFDGVPLIGQFARMIVREQFNQKRGLAKRITQRKIAQETDLELDRRLEEGLKQSEMEFQQRILGPLHRLSLDPLIVSMSTTEQRLNVRYRLAHESQLTAFTPRPRAPANNLISLQVHQSTLNNLLERMELTGREWKLAELYQHLGSLLNKQWDPPEDVPDDITLTFADRNPLNVELADGQLRLKLRFAEFRRDEGLSLRNFTVTSSYIPVADGLMAGLIRDPDGVIEIQGKHLSIRERLAVRVIFSKVFVSQPEISFVSEQWTQDPKARDLGISQLTLRDGWLAVAISPSDNPLVSEVAKQSQQSLSTISR